MLNLRLLPTRIRDGNMKRISCLLVLLATIWNLSLQAQESELVIDGIGKLKLGSPSAVLSEYGYDVRRAVQINTPKAYFNKIYKNYTDHILYQLFPDTKAEYNSIAEATFHPDVKVFYVPKLELIQGLVCKGVVLKYLNDSLYSIEVHHPWDLEQALILKYGLLSEKERQKDCRCTVLGIQLDKKETTTTRIYNTGDPKIYCYASFTKGYDRNCDEKIIYFWMLYSEREKELVRLYDAQLSKEKKEKREKERLEILKEL